MILFVMFTREKSEKRDSVILPKKAPYIVST